MRQALLELCRYAIYQCILFPLAEVWVLYLLDYLLSRPHSRDEVAPFLGQELLSLLCSEADREFLPLKQWILVLSC